MLVFCERVDLEHGGVLREEEVVQVHQDLSDAIDSEIRQYWILYYICKKRKEKMRVQNDQTDYNNISQNSFCGLKKILTWNLD